MGLEFIISAVILLVSLIILDKASHMSITNAVKVSEITGFGKTTIGFTIISFSTTLPELSVAVISALTGVAGVSIGNVFGSVIVNICLIVGLGLLFASWKGSKPPNTNPTIAKGEAESLFSGLFVASIIPLSLIYIEYASQLIGFILLAIFAIFTYQLLRSKKLTEDNEANKPREEEMRPSRYILLTFAGVSGVVASSYFIVDSTSNIAEMLGIPPSLIAAIIIAFGTSLPEFSIGIKAITKGEPAITIGNIIGANFLNITLVLGVTLAASPLRVNMRVFSDLVIFSIIANLLLWYFLTTGRMGWKEGAILLFIYALFLATTFGAVQIGPAPNSLT